MSDNDPKYLTKSLWDTSTSHIFQNVSFTNTQSNNLKTHGYHLRRHPVHFANIDGISDKWTLENIAIAGKILRKPPMPVRFQDTHQMKKIYSIINDVFRYKNVLNEALVSARFFSHYTQFVNDQKRVWLLLFELYIRHFLERPATEANLQDLIFSEADLDKIAACLWEHRIRLAAAISRHRIKNRVLRLSDLLSPNLKDSKELNDASNSVKEAI